MTTTPFLHLSSSHFGTYDASFQEVVARETLAAEGLSAPTIPTIPLIEVSMEKGLAVCRPGPARSRCELRDELVQISVEGAVGADSCGGISIFYPPPGSRGSAKSDGWGPIARVLKGINKILPKMRVIYRN
jgi:hypothetical protein